MLHNNIFSIHSFLSQRFCVAQLIPYKETVCYFVAYEKLYQFNECFDDILYIYSNKIFNLFSSPTKNHLLSFITIFTSFIISRKLLHIHIDYKVMGERFLYYIVTSIDI